ncbi:MAG: alpha/beta hydrolase [Cyanophyceae cyanobacterium]
MKSASVLAKGVFIFGGVILAAYFGLSVCLRLWQTRLIFFPTATLAATPTDVGLKYEEVRLPMSVGEVHGWWIPAQGEHVLLYFHGNASNIGDLVYRAARFQQMGLSVLLIDYRGYGYSTGSFPSEASAYEDAEAAWQYLTQTRQISPQNIFLFGQSLGGAIAIDLAIRQPHSAGVIVESTFTSIRAMVDHVGTYQLLPIDWILTQRFDSLAKIRTLQMPFLFIHGSSDRTVPPRMSQELYAATNGPKQLLLIPEAGHNDVAIVEESKYYQAIQEFVQKYQ